MRESPSYDPAASPGGFPGIIGSAGIAMQELDPQHIMRYWTWLTLINQSTWLYNGE